MRHIVRSRIVAALERQKPAIEEFISQRLQYPLGFPYKLAPAALVICEVRAFKIVPLAKGSDYPPVRIEALLKTRLVNRAVQIRGEWDPGVLDADVQLTARCSWSDNRVGPKAVMQDARV